MGVTLYPRAERFCLRVASEASFSPSSCRIRLSQSRLRRPQEVDPQEGLTHKKKERIAIDTPLFYSLDPAETGRSLLVHLEAIVAIHQEADCLLGCCHAGVVVGLCCLRAHLLWCEEDA